VSRTIAALEREISLRIEAVHAAGFENGVEADGALSAGVEAAKTVFLRPGTGDFMACSAALFDISSLPAVTYRGSAFHRDKEYRIAVARLLFPFIRLSEVSTNAFSCLSGGPACSARAARAGLVPVTSRIDAPAWSHGKAWPHGKDLGRRLFCGGFGADSHKAGPRVRSRSCECIAGLTDEPDDAVLGLVGSIRCLASSRGSPPRRWNRSL
jgi:hypothetical protein